MNKVRLGDVATYINGYAFKPDDRGSVGLPIIRIQDLTGNSYDLGFYDGEYPKRIEINNGDVLISWSASLGVYVWNKGKALLNQHIFKVVFDKLEIDKQFFVYAVEHNLKEMVKQTHGATMKHIIKKDFDNTLIPYPSLEHQKRIAKLLDKTCDLIEKMKTQSALMEELIKARFVEMFGDPETESCIYPTFKLKELSIKISDGVHSKPEYTDKGRPFLSVVNINRKKVDFTNCKFVSEESYQKMIKSTHPEKGDVLYTKVGATYGIPAYVDTDIEFCLYVSVCLIKPKHDLINSKYLAIQMDMPFVKHQADRRIKGIGVPDLHLNQISEFDIICPPREIQDSFVCFVEQTDKSKLAVQKSIEKLEILKKSLMQEYFG